MKTSYKKQGDLLVVQVDGKLDYETQEPLKSNLGKILDNPKRDEVPKKIIFDLSHLEFVGSSGISNFIQTLSDFNHKSTIRPRYCNVASEFKKVMKAFDDSDLFEFFDSTDKAKRSFEQ